MPPWLLVDVDRALDAALPEEERAAARTQTISIAVQVSRSEEHMVETLLQKYSGLLSRAMAHNSQALAFSVWHLHFSKKQDRQNKCSGAASGFRRKMLQRILWFWRQYFHSSTTIDSQLIEFWLSRVSDRDTCQRVFSEWASYCRPHVTPPRLEQVEEETHALDVTITTSPLQMGSAPRVMGMTPPQPSYASPTHSETGLEELESSSLVWSAKSEGAHMASHTHTHMAPLVVTITTSPLQVGAAPRVMGMAPPKPSYGSTAHSGTGADEVESSGMSTVIESSSIDGSAESERADISRGSSRAMISRRRMRHMVIEWSLTAAKQRQIRWHLALILRRSERGSTSVSDTLAVYFKGWHKRKGQIALYVMRMQTTRRRAALEKSVVTWSQFLREQFLVRKIGRKIYFQAARAILHTWSMYVDEHLKLVRVAAVFAMRSDRGRMLLNFKAWVKWTTRQNKRCDFDIAILHRYLLTVFRAWKGRLLEIGRAHV